MLENLVLYAEIFKNQYLGLVVIFLLNAVNVTMSNLKTVFLSKDIVKPVYVTTFIDAVVFTYSIKLVAGSSGVEYIIAYAFGRLSGVYLATWIENKLSFGVVEIIIYKHPDDGKRLADDLRCKGYSVTTSIGYGIAGKERMVLNIITPKSSLNKLQAIFEQYGKVNMAVKPVSKVYGKLAR